MARKKQTENFDKQENDEQKKSENAPSSNKAASQDEKDADTADKDKKELGFPIVGIGASAGGLEAFEKFFTSMPADDATAETGMAFVLVQHLDPDHKSILVDLVKRYTKMKVFEVQDGMAIQPNCAYIIPPNRDMAILHGKLHLMEPVAPRGLRLPIDSFFRSMAQDMGDHTHSLNHSLSRS